MNNIFLPKALNKDDSSAVCYDVQNGYIKTEIHWHSCAEIIHMRYGVANVFLSENWRMIYAGDTVFLPPGQLHCCYCEDENACRVVVGLDEGVIPSIGIEREAAVALFRVRDFNEMLIFRKDDELSGLFEKIQSPCNCLSVSEKLRAVLNIQEIYLHMLHIWEKMGAVSREKIKNPLIAEIEKIISESYTEQISAEYTAKKLNISYSHMAALINRELNTNFKDLLLKARIDAAKRFLLTTDFSVTDIALESGFTDSSYFIKKFREYTGTTPYKYRLENLKRIN